MSQPMNMNPMAATGAPGGPQNNAIAASSAPLSSKDIRTKFHTCIYDYFMKTQHYDIARTILREMGGDILTQPKQSPNRKDVNGNGDSMDGDSKEDVKKPDDLPHASVPPPADSPFLYEWFCQFWDLFEAQRNRGSVPAKTFLNHAQQRVMTDRRVRAEPPLSSANMGIRNMMPNGMQMPQELLAKRIMMQGGRGNPTPQQMQQMQQQRLQVIQQTQMQRDGSSIDINGQQRPQSPGSGENAPSPKRQRIDGNFNGTPIGPMGRGQPQGMPGQQFNGMQMANPQAKVEYSKNLQKSLKNALESNVNKGMPGNAAGLSQGSPAMDSANADFMNNNGNMRGQATANNNNSSNHALQDYQMQLMLLEQQNKKRLLMARQEQDSMSNGPGGPAQPGQPGAFAPAMSPQGSRAGLSPNPSEQMKRGTPKMSQGVVPSPTPEAVMGQGRVSPAPGFDPSMNPNMPQNMFPQMNKMAMMGPNGPMMQPPGPHPGMGGPMNQQQMEMFARQQNGGRMPNGAFMQGAPPGMMPGQPGGPVQQPPNMTPQQRNATMPPPPAPSGDIGRGTQPSSPQQPAAPPTPSQGNKPNAKNKKENKGTKKASAKKGTTGATPVSEAELPPTPTPAPPITPTSTQAFPPKNGTMGPNHPGQGPQNAMPQQNQPDLGVAGGPFGNLDGSDFPGMNLDFAGLEGPDVLDNFDFDSFLNNEAGDGGFGFDANMGFGDTGLEAGGE